MSRLFLSRLACLVFLVPGSAFCATIYTAKTGSDSNSCTQSQNEATPKLTISGGVGCLSSGDTLIVKAGTYDEGIGTSVPNGTSWANVTTIRKKQGDTVIIKRTSGSFARCVEFPSGQQYIEIDGIDCDGSVAGYDGVKFEGTTGFIRLKNMEVWGHPNQAVVDGATGGNNEFLNLYVHNNGTTDFGHGIYVQSDGNKIWNSDFRANKGFGIQIYKSNGNPSNNDIQYNRSSDNGASGTRGSGVVVVGSSNLVANNLVWNNLESGIQVLSGSNHKIYNNTSYGNGTAGISVDSGSNIQLINNIVFASGNTIVDSGSGTTKLTNLTTDPGFRDVGSLDFSLREGSPAVDAGSPLAEIATDFVGTQRPQGASIDIGAFEYTGQSQPPPPAASTPQPPAAFSAL